MSKPSRSGVTVTEIMVAVAILAVGMFPIFNLYRGSRLGIGISRDLVELQEEAHYLMNAAKMKLRTGQVTASAIDGDMVVNATNGELRSTVTISKGLNEGRLLTIRVRTERKGRFYKAQQMVSDPYGAITKQPAEAGGE